MSYEGQAPFIEEDDEYLVLERIKRSRHPERNRALFLLSISAGLRVVELSGLTWWMVLDSKGKIRKNQVEIPANISKGGYGKRKIAIPDIATLALEEHYNKNFTHPQKPLFASERTGKKISPNCLSQWFLSLYEGAGLRVKGMTGASSHSGRRTFITRAAREISKFNLSLHDVMKMAGHAYLTTTQGYIENNVDAQVNMQNSIYSGRNR